MKENIQPATGRLGVLVVGVGGAVSTTLITGTLAARKGLAKPIGSITQMATMRVQSGEEKQIKDIVPIADLNDIVFGGWDIFPDNAYEAALYAEVLKEKDLNLVKDELEAISHISPKEQMPVEPRRRHTTHTDTHTFQCVTAHGRIHRTDVEQRRLFFRQGEIAGKGHLQGLFGPIERRIGT